LDAQRRLHFNGNCRIGPLQIGTGHDDTVDIRGSTPGTLQRFLGSLDRHLAQNRPLVITAFRDVGHHTINIQNALLVSDMPALDTGGLFNELAAGQRCRIHLPGGNGGSVLRVETFRPGIEAGHQLVVTDAVRGGVQTCATDDYFMHGRASLDSTCSGVSNARPCRGLSGSPTAHPGRYMENDLRRPESKSSCGSRHFGSFCHISAPSCSCHAISRLNPPAGGPPARDTAACPSADCRSPGSVAGHLSRGSPARVSSVACRIPACAFPAVARTGIPGTPPASSATDPGVHPHAPPPGNAG